MVSSARKKSIDERFMKSIERFNLKIHEENIVVLDVGYVPLFVKFTIGLGNTFGFPIQPNEICEEEFKLALIKIGEQICEYGTYQEWKIGARRILRMITNKRFKGNKFQRSAVQQFIGNQFTRTVEFLKRNPNIFISQADKGGKVVVMSKRMYDMKMSDYLDNCVKDHAYFKCNQLELNDVGALVEKKYESLIFKLNPYLDKDRMDGLDGLCFPLNFQPYVIAKIYGNIKVHKPEFSVRPIIS